MFCRYCGSHIADDSLFCAKCGKRLGKRDNPRLTKIIQTLRLKTPYPYSAILLIVFVVWTITARQNHADYSHVKWSFELERRVDVPNENLFQQAMWLVIENTGTNSLAEVPIDLSAKISPQKRADVEADFLGRKLLILQQGHTLPVTVVLAGQLNPGEKKRIPINGSIQAEPPFKVTYELRAEDRQPVLASYVVEE